MTAWVHERRELPHYALKHSTNQKVMKRDADFERKFEALVKRKPPKNDGLT